MRTGCMLFLLGCVCVTRLTAFPPYSATLIFLFGMYLFRRLRLCRYFLWITAGFVWAMFRAEFILDQALIEELSGRSLVMEGRVISLPVVSNNTQRFLVKVNSLEDRKGNIYRSPGKVRLSWYGNSPELIPGDHWRLSVKLKRARGLFNPGTGDYVGRLFQQGITTTGYVNKKKGNQKLKSDSNWNIHRFRYYLRNKFVELLPSKLNPVFLQALILGDRSSLNTNHWEILTKTGTSHLLAISGLHIGLIAGFVFFLTRWLWSLMYYTNVFMASPRVASFAAMSAAIGYAGLAGFAVPTQRALIMLFVVLSCSFLGRLISASKAISIALFCVLLADPFAILSPGFWLSFTAVSVIAFGMLYRVQASSLWWRLGRVQVVVGVGLLPLLVAYFQQFPLTSIAINMILVPWVSFLTLPLMMLGSVLIFIHQKLAVILLSLGIQSLDIIWPYLQQLAVMDNAMLILPAARPVGFVCCAVGVLLLLMPAGLPGRWLSLCWMLPLFTMPTSALAPGQLKLTLLDVGQGLALVVETQKHVLLYDTGPSFGSHYDSGKMIVVPFLRQKNLNQLDLVIQSHGDNDHIGGLKSVLDEVPVKKILTSVPEKIRFSNIQRCIAGQSWQWDGVSFNILHPTRGGQLSGNNASCVLKIDNGRYAVLVTGDIEVEAEEYLLKHSRNELFSQVIIVPHHGSLTSSGEGFISAVKASFALIPVGYQNRFGFPKKDIITRYRERGTKILDTAQDGAIEMTISTEAISIRSYREYASRLWHMNK